MKTSGFAHFVRIGGKMSEKKPALHGNEAKNQGQDSARVCQGVIFE